MDLNFLINLVGIMVERRGPGSKYAYKKARVALMDDLLGKIRLFLFFIFIFCRLL